MSTTSISSTMNRVLQIHVEAEGRASSPLHENEAQHERAAFVIDRVKTMMRQEQTSYLYRRFVKPPPTSKYLHEDPEDIARWREKICHWTYSVVDHFNLSRKTVAVSVNLFDRYLASQGNRCDGSLALLISLTTLYIAIKVNETKKIKLETLTELSRCQFSKEDIEAMEIKILTELSWLIHPPTVLDFIFHLLKFLPPEVEMAERQQIFEHSRYMAELAVSNPFFIEHHPSTIAFASILNVLQLEMNGISIPVAHRHYFYQCLERELGFNQSRQVVRFVRNRLVAMVYSSPSSKTLEKDCCDDNTTVSSDQSMVSTSSVSRTSSKLVGDRSRCNSTDTRSSTRSSSSSKRRSYQRRESFIQPASD